MKDYPELAQEMRVGIRNLRKDATEPMRGFAQFMGSALKDGALSNKTKEMITLGISMAVRCDGCIAAHVRNLHEMGATREEVMEVAMVAASMGGGPGVITAVETMAAFDQYVAKAEATDG